MWPFSSYRFSSLKGRLVFAAVIPGILATALVVLFQAWNFNTQLHKLHTLEQESILNWIAHHAGTHFRIHDTTSLQTLAQQSLSLPAVRAIRFLDANHQVLGDAGAWHREALLRRTQPITPTGQSTPIGWVEIAFSTDEWQLLLYRNYLMLVLILMIVSCLAIVLGSILFSRTTSAFRNIQQQLQAISKGQFDVEISRNHNEELDALVETLNAALHTFATHQQELQEHINQSTQDLRETLETVEIQNIELDLARKEALNASKIKSEFLANTSHEIRTPLNGIIGFTRILLKECKDSQQREHLLTIQQSSENLLNLINDILDLSKIEAGKLVLEHDSFNIHQITEETLQILAPSAHEKGLELTHIIDTQVPDFFYGDAPRLKQILTNLIGNAIKFSNTGGILVRIALENHETSSVLMKCSVSDTGIGIRRSQLNKELFSAFSQTGGNTPQQRSGAGLGLAISKKLVDQMGGDIGIDSEENVGSTFWFTLKLDIDHHSIQAAPAPIRLTDKSFLLFDTHTASRQCIMNMLTSWGARLSITQDYADVLPTLSANSHQPREEWFAAVFISIPVDTQHFPMDRLTELVSGAKRFCPVVVVTSTTLRHYLEKILPAGTLYLGKPVTQNKLVQALHASQVITTPPLHELAAIESFLITSSSTGFRLKILAVDDQDANLRLLTRLLRDLGHDVEEAENGRQALILCQQHLFDCIFMDIRMPVMDGIETTRRIRLLENNNRNTPVIAVTAQVMADQKQQLLMAGLDDYLSKPIDENQLTQVIARWSNKISAAKQAASKTVSEDAIEKCVDIELSLKLSHGKGNLAAEMLSMLLNELPDTRQEIQRAWEEKRFADARELIHKLHGACCYCGVPALKAICKKLEIHLNTRLESPTASDQQAFHRAIDSLLVWRDQYSIEDLFS